MSNFYFNIFESNGTGTMIYVPVGQHVSLRVPLEDGSMLTRSYTPVTPTMEAGPQCDGRKIHLIIKIYEQGKMTRKLDSLSIGERNLKMPFWNIQYIYVLFFGNFSSKSR